MIKEKLVEKMGFKCLVMGYDISDNACDNCSLKCEFNKKVKGESS